MKIFNFLFLLIFAILLFSCDPRRTMDDDKAKSIFLVQRKILINNGNWESNYYFTSDLEDHKLYMMNSDDITKIVDIETSKKVYVLNETIYENNLITNEKTKRPANNSDIEDYYNRKESFQEMIIDVIKNDSNYNISGIETHVEVVELFLNMESINHYEYFNNVKSASIDIFFDRLYRLNVSITLFFDDYNVIHSIVLFSDSNNRSSDSLFPTDLNTYK